jgi:hypothetical protein
VGTPLLLPDLDYLEHDELMPQVILLILVVCLGHKVTYSTYLILHVMLFTIVSKEEVVQQWYLPLNTVASCDTK